MYSIDNLDQNKVSHDICLYFQESLAFSNYHDPVPLTQGLGIKMTDNYSIKQIRGCHVE